MEISINGYAEPMIPFGAVCNALPPSRLIIAPRPRCALTHGHQGSHQANKDDVYVEWDFTSGFVKHPYGYYREIWIGGSSNSDYISNGWGTY